MDVIMCEECGHIYGMFHDGINCELCGGKLVLAKLDLAHTEAEQEDQPMVAS